MKPRRRAAKKRKAAKKQLAKEILSEMKIGKKQQGIVPDWLQERMKENR
jgi:hypothetical protein